MPRVAVVASHPIQYQAPWFRALARVTDLEVFFCHRQDGEAQAAAGFGVPFQWDVPLLDGYRFRWLRNVAGAPDVSRFSGCDTPEIGEALAAGRFDACIVNGWYLKSYMQAIRACRRQGIKVLVRGDSHLKTPRSRIKATLKHLPYRWFLNRIDAHLYVGSANRAYLRSYRVPEARLFPAPHFVDNELFATRADQARASGDAASVRKALGIPSSAVVFVLVGKFVENKHADDFVRACALMRRGTSTPVHGLLVGDGPLRADLERLASEIDAPVQFAGFRNQSELPVYYAAADALVLPSETETWGLVVNEAMACGLPAIVSAEVGCAEDLIEEGVTGFVFPAGDIGQLARRMGQIAAVDRDRMRRGVLARIQEYTVGAAVKGTMDALAATLHVSQRAMPAISEVAGR